MKEKSICRFLMLLYTVNRKLIMEVLHMTNSVVKVENVQKVYGKKSENSYQALDRVSFTIEKGEFVGIMGPSGAGKTTLLNVVSTLEKATAGTIEIAGQDITKMKQNQLADFR